MKMRKYLKEYQEKYPIRYCILSILWIIVCAVLANIIYSNLPSNNENSCKECNCSYMQQKTQKQAH